MVSAFNPNYGGSTTIGNLKALHSATARVMETGDQIRQRQSQVVQELQANIASSSHSGIGRLNILA